MGGYIVVLFFLVEFCFLNLALAQSTAVEELRAGISGRIRLQQRVSEKNNEYFDSTRAYFRADGFVRFNSCSKLAGRVATGEKFASESANLGIGDDDTEVSLRFKHLYLDTNCLRKNITVQAGALPVFKSGRLGLTPNGWVDGIRVIVEEENSGRQWVLERGDVDQIENPNFWDRSINFKELNHTELQLTQPFGKDDQFEVLVVVSKFNDTTYFRSGLDMALSDYVAFLDSIQADVLVRNGEEVGNFAQVAKSVGSWRFRLLRSDLVPATIEDLVKDYYGLGENYTLEIQRQLTEDYLGQGRFRIGEAGNMIQFEVRRAFSLSR